MSLSPAERVELPIGGMTCASCATRIERKLNKLEGVHATVNYATEKARVEFDPAAVAPEALVEAVEAAGYSTRPCRRPSRRRRRRRPTRRCCCSGGSCCRALLSVPALLLAMIPALQFDNFQWLSLNLVTPVVLWAAWPFHRAAWLNLRHGAATMDTLVSVGVLAAWLWSLYALFIGDAGMNDMRMTFDVLPNAGEGADRLPRDGRRRPTTFLLAGRVFEARPVAQVPRWLPCWSSAPRTSPCSGRTGPSARIPVEQLAVGDRFVVRPGREGGRPTASSRRARRPSTLAC